MPIPFLIMFFKKGHKMANIKDLRRTYDVLAKQVATHLKINEANQKEVDAYNDLRKRKREAFVAWHDAANAPTAPTFVDDVPSGNLKTIPQVSTIRETIPLEPTKEPVQKQDASPAAEQIKEPTKEPVVPV